MNKKMKILIVGCGSIGKRHIRNLLSLGYKNTFACRVISKKNNEIKEIFGIPCYTNINKALSLKPAVTFICTPTSQHLSFATKSLNARSHVFLEKPISHNLRGIHRLLKLARKRHRLIFIGYQFRFHPILSRIKEIIGSRKYGKPVSFHISIGNYLPQWHPWEDYRISYAGRKSLGGGVVLTLSHEIDFAQHFFGEIKYVAAFINQSGVLQIDTEDTADILLRHKNHVSGTVHLNYLEKPMRQRSYIVLEKGRIEWDLQKNYLKVYSSSGLRPKITRYPKHTRNHMFLKEIKHFFSLIGNHHLSYSNFEKSLHTLQVACAALSSAKKNKLIRI